MTNEQSLSFKTVKMTLDKSDLSSQEASTLPNTTEVSRTDETTSQAHLLQPQSNTSTLEKTSQQPVAVKASDPNQAQKAKEESSSDRGEWGHKLDFMMSCIGFAVGLGNIWRFPFLCYKNGGGAFLIPYFICLIFSGVPVFYFETTLGQLLGKGFLSIWGICPILKGVGYSSLILIFWLNSYYIVIIGWSLYYLAMSFSWEVPWSKCKQEWNTKLCHSTDDIQKICREFFVNKANSTIASTLNSTKELGPEMLRNCTKGLGVKEFKDPVREYWDHHVLRTTPNMETSGGIHWGMFISLVCAWGICFWAMYKGIRTTGKILYVTALFPYFCLLILFIRGITLDGAWNGIVYYIKPDLARILDPNVWNDAATQIFYSNGVGIGAWIALSSYNKFNNNVLQDTIIISVINFFTAIFSGLTVFSIIGFMAHQQNKDIAEVAESGSGLTFIVYPSATLNMPFVQLWSVLFFIMMIMLGLGSEFVQLESFFTGVIDESPDILREHRSKFIAGVCIVNLIGGLAFVCKGGIYWFELFDYYAASGFALLSLIFFETIAVFWIYGSDNYVARVEYMLNRKVGWYWIICWKYLTPIICLAIFLFSVLQHKRLEYIGYEYPDWAIAFGWFIALSSITAVPIYAVCKFFMIPGSFVERWDKLIKAQHQKIDRIIRDRANLVPSHANKPLPGYPLTENTDGPESKDSTQKR